MCSSPLRTLAALRGSALATWRRAFCAALLVSGPIVAFALLWQYQCISLGSQRQPTAVKFQDCGRLRSSPLDVDCSIQRDLKCVHRHEIVELLKSVEPKESGMSASDCLHVLATHGLNAAFQSQKLSSSQSVLQLFCDDVWSTEYFGSPLWFKTRYGIRPSSYRAAGASRESHYDQTIASMAKLGLSLDTPIGLQGRSYSLRDVMRDSIASFDLKQAEIEWTSIAYALYLPPASSWVNKFGAECTFDQLAHELLQRNPARSSCAGGHLLEALITLVDVEKEFPHIISGESKRLIEERLSHLVKRATANRLEDGSWNVDWSNEPTNKPSYGPLPSRLLATSHTLHWLIHVPARDRPQAEFVTTSARWIKRHLQVADRGLIESHFCPCTHGVSVLAELADDGTN
jgi:hypothetical protein